jgi:creatinine amidohydrolase
MGGYSIFDGTIADMTWVEVEQAAKKRAIMLVPIGVIEQHGPHLPLGTDMYAGYLMCFLMKNELDRLGIATVVAPPYYFGMNETTGMFPGSITIRRESMIAVLTDIFFNYKKFGFSKQFILNHHGDPQHNDAIIQAILSAREEDVDAVYVMGGFVQHFIEEAYASAYKKALPLPPHAIIKAEESDKTKQARVRLTKSEMHVHAEEKETSMIMRWYPDLLRKKDEIKTFKAVTPTAEEFATVLEGRWRDISPLGYIGDPSVATEENGELYAYEAIDIASAIAKFLKQKK